jgi:RNA polymerase sigma-70 factor, ECF subfamily
MNEAEDIESAIGDVLSGNIERYELLIRLFQREVGRIVWAGRFDSSMAQDMTQRVFMKAYLGLNQYRRGTNFGAWIKGIARNAIREEFRRKKCLNRHLEIYRQEVERDFDMAEQGEDPQAKRIEALGHCRETLPEKYSHVVNLRYDKSLSMEAIAAAVQSSVDAVKQMLWRARLMLRKCVESRMAVT